MKRLLIVTTVPLTLRSFLLPFVHHFQACGWQVDAMAAGVANDSECLANFDQVWDVEWSRNPLDAANLLTVPAKVRQIVERGNYDIVHVHTPVAAFVTRFAMRSRSKGSKPAVIYTAHGFHFYQGGSRLRNAIFLGLEKLAGHWTDHLVVINREDEEAAKRWAIVPSTRLHYMPGIGVDLSVYHPDAIAPSDIQRIRHELDVAPDVPLILVLAEFTTRKRHCDIVNAFAQVAHPTACLVMAGPGPLIENIQQLAVDLGVQDRTRFLGFRRDAPVLIRAANMLVLASEHEGLPRSVMEALCLETPVIGTNVRGTRDLLSDNGGVLVEVGDVNGLAQAMNWVLGHPEDAHAMAKRGRDQMQLYDVQKILALHDQLYAEALGEKHVVNHCVSAYPTY